MGNAFEGGNKKGEVVNFGEKRKELIGEAAAHPENIVDPKKTAAEIIAKGKPEAVGVLPSINAYSMSDMNLMLRHYANDASTYTPEFIYAIAVRYLAEIEKIKNDNVEK